MESTRATMNTMVGPTWVKPSDFPKAIAHTDSIHPDATSTSQLTDSSFPDRAGRCGQPGHSRPAPSSPYAPALFVDHHRRVVAGDDLFGEDIGVQVLLHHGGQLVGRRRQIVGASRIHGLDDEEGLLRCIGQRRALAVAPVPAATDGAGVVAVAQLAFQRGGVLVLAERTERVAALGDAEANIAGMASMSSPPTGSAYVADTVL